MKNLNNGDVAEVQYATSTERHLVDATPNPRLLESLRDMGYDNRQAIEDIIDNSVDALVRSDVKNPRINVITKFGADGRGRISIIDNGIGMTLETLNEALKLGSDTNKERNGELGYFGVGLNSASISMGRGFKVITKHADGDYLCGIFDLDIAIKEKSWKFVSIEKANPDEIKHFKALVGARSSGTVLEIYKLDRLSNRNKTAFDAIVLKSIAKTYRYYITGRNGISKIIFFLNDTKVTPIDPMGTDLKGTTVLNKSVLKQKYQFNVDGELAEIVVKYFYVDTALETEYPTEKLNGRNNGFYVMRNHRQIMEAERFDFKIDKYSGWQSNFRAELIFDGKYDEIFKTNVMKNRIIIPQTLTDLMQPDVTEAIKYCKLEKKKTMPESTEELDEDVLKNTKSIVKQKNETKTTPTVLTDKNGNPIKKEKIEGIDDEPEVEDKEKRERKKEEKKRKPKTYSKIDVDFVNFGEDSSFFFSHHQGNGKFLIRINVDHNFYREFARLDRQGQKFIIDLLHSFALASRQELYSDDLNQIDELVRTWSNFLRRDLNGKE